MTRSLERRSACIGGFCAAFSHTPVTSVATRFCFELWFRQGGYNGSCAVVGLYMEACSSLHMQMLMPRRYDSCCPSTELGHKDRRI